MKKQLIDRLKNSKYKPLLKRIYRFFIKIYPYEVGNEIGMIKNVLKSGVWNMSDVQGLHRVLEKEFAEYIGVKHAIVVNTGGVAIQMSIRALGLQKGDEIIHQVDTCVANTFSVMNAGTVPVFADISLETFKLDFDDLETLITPNTKAIMPIHVWGNTENMDMVRSFANQYNLKVIEDCALAFGAEYNGEKVGSFGDVGIFSFGSTKPIQAGEGGIITTNNDELAKKLRAMRMWGEMTQEYGIRDHEILSWNGRTSEVVVAVMLEQFRGYEKRYKNFKNNVEYFLKEIEDIKYISIADRSKYNTKPAYAQVVLRLNTKIEKQYFMDSLKEKKISVWHANFEQIPTISFFKNFTWKEWTDSKNIEWLSLNYHKQFKNSQIVYDKIGIGLMPNNFSTRKTTDRTLNKIRCIIKNMDIVE